MCLTDKKSEVRKMEILEERMAALENEQLLIKRNLQENLELDKELIQIVKELHCTIEENTIKTKQEKSKRNIDDELVTNRKCLEYQVYTNGSIFRVRKKAEIAIILSVINGIANVLLAIAYCIK